MKWFINENGDVYDYPTESQEADFPNDFHTAYNTEQEAKQAAERLPADPEQANEHQPHHFVFSRVAHTPGFRLRFDCTCGQSNLVTTGKDDIEAKQRAEAICRTHVPVPASTEKWSVYRVDYVAVKPDQRLKAGDRTFFEASSIQECLEKLRARDVDPANVTVTRTDFTQTATGPFEVKLGATIETTEGQA